MKKSSGPTKWAIPYIDFPIEVWQHFDELFNDHIGEVYFPLLEDIISSGEPTQSSQHREAFLRDCPFACTALLNPITLKRPVEEITPRVIDELRRLRDECGLKGATVTNLTLARRVREKLPDLELTGSCLMMITKPNQVAMLGDVFDTLVPGARIVRDLPALRSLKAAFPGKIRFLVNESCLPGCIFRIQHFHEMGCDFAAPRSLCWEMLSRDPWLRLTGGWVLPQHLHLFEGVYDELKLGGRVTLRKPAKYIHVLDSYINHQPLTPNVLGGGPASVLQPIDVTEAFYKKTLNCDQECHTCSLCRTYYEQGMRKLEEEGRLEAVTVHPIDA